MPPGYSYVRWSHPSQGDGNSYARQTDGRAENWCKRNSVQFDPTLILVDKGKSASNRKNWDSYALAKFIEAAKSGRAAKGSYLIVENLGRISREDPVTATNLFTGILLLDINVVQLNPEKVFTKGGNFGDLIQAIVEFSRGHSESVQKVDRVGSAWADKRASATAKPMTSKMPGWITVDREYVGGRVRFLGKPRLIPERAEVVRRIFQLTADGYGIHGIAMKFNKEGVLCWRKPHKANRDRRVVWNETAVYFILKSIATYGAFQPCGRDRKPVGEPIPDYFEPAITVAQFHAAHRGLKTRLSRTPKAGQRGKNVNILAGLLVDVRDGDRFTFKHDLQTAVSHPQIIPVGAKQGTGGKWTSFPADIFETAILSQLEEVQPADVLPVSFADEKVAELSRAHEEAKALVDKYKALMEADRSKFELFADMATKAEVKRKKLAGELTEAQREVASPMSETWGQFKNVVALLNADKSDDMTIKVKAAVRRVVSCMRCLFLGGKEFKSRKRLALVQVEFQNSTARRTYLITYWARRYPLDEHWLVSSFKLDDGSGDFRDSEFMRGLEATMNETIDEAIEAI